MKFEDPEDNDEFPVFAADYISKKTGIYRRKVIVYFHGIVGEYCIEIDGKWSGYICPSTMEFDNYLLQ